MVSIGQLTEQEKYEILDKTRKQIGTNTTWRNVNVSEDSPVLEAEKNIWDPEKKTIVRVVKIFVIVLNKYTLKATAHYLPLPTDDNMTTSKFIRRVLDAGNIGRDKSYNDREWLIVTEHIEIHRTEDASVESLVKNLERIEKTFQKYYKQHLEFAIQEGIDLSN